LQIKQNLYIILFSTLKLDKMTDARKLTMNADGEEYDIYISQTEDIDIVESDPDYRDEDVIDLEKVHKSIRGYAKYAIDAFRNIDMPEVEKVTLKFNLKIAGKTGIPMLMEGSTESNFEIQVECKFVDRQKSGT
jgi:Trypsin-co-occurring domain 1